MIIDGKRFTEDAVQTLSKGQILPLTYDGVKKDYVVVYLVSPLTALVVENGAKCPAPVLLVTTSKPILNAKPKNVVIPAQTIPSQPKEIK